MKAITGLVLALVILGTIFTSPIDGAFGGVTGGVTGGTTGGVTGPPSILLNSMLDITLALGKSVFDMTKHTCDSTAQLLNSKFTLRYNEITQPISLLLDEPIIEALQTFQATYNNQLPDLEHFVNLLVLRTGSLKNAASGIQNTIENAIAQTKRSTNKCSPVKVNAILNQIHMCVNDAMKIMTTELTSLVDHVNEKMNPEISDITMKHKECRAMEPYKVPLCIMELEMKLPEQFNAIKIDLTITTDINTVLSPVLESASKIAADATMLCY